MTLSFRDWTVPLSQGHLTLREAASTLEPLGVPQHDVPFLIQLVENPKYDLPGIDIFSGATDLHTHDFIHMLLGRGLLMKDEAFVLGFTMGSTDRCGAVEERLYTLIAKHLYPKPYRFGDEEERVFKDAVRLGYISDCRSLAEVDYAPLMDLTLAQVRQQIGIEDDLLRAYYGVEKRRYPQARESQRLFD
jgi:hypothetical protein